MNWNEKKNSFPYWNQNPFTIHNTEQRRYKILCVSKVKDIAQPEKVAQIILNHLEMPEENYRMGKTKVFLFSSDEQIKKQFEYL